MSVIQISCIGLALLASVIDIRERRIPNWLTFGGALAAFSYHAWVNGLPGVGIASAGWLVGAAVFFLPFALGGLGAGDVKLVAALGAWLGWYDALWLGLYTGVAGGVLAVVASAWTGYLRQAITNVRLLLMHWKVMGLTPLPELTIHHGTGPKLAYGVAILAGTMVTVWMH